MKIVKFLFVLVSIVTLLSAAVSYADISANENSNTTMLTLNADMEIGRAHV